MVQDVQFDANLTITSLDTMIADGVDGIAIVVPDRALGPVAIEKAAAANIPLVAVDDDIYSASEDPAPYVGINAQGIGNQVGTEVANLVKSEGWDSDLSNVRVASIEDQKADTCMQRNRGAQETFLNALPDFPEDQILHVPYDNTMVNAIDVMLTTLTANPQVEKWIFWSCNDDGVLGGVRATENAGLSPENVIGVGIDGSRTCEAFNSGEATGFRGSMWLDSAKHGAAAVELLYNAVVKGEEIPISNYQEATFVNQDNFSELKGRLGCS